MSICEVLVTSQQFLCGVIPAFSWTPCSRQQLLIFLATTEACTRGARRQDSLLHERQEQLQVHSTSQRTGWQPPTASNWHSSSYSSKTSTLSSFAGHVCLKACRAAACRQHPAGQQHNILSSCTPGLSNEALLGCLPAVMAWCGRVIACTRYQRIIGPPAVACSLTCYV